MSKHEISTEEIVICPWCGKETTIKEYDEYTHLSCVNREMRRAYLPLNNTKAFEASNDNNHYYRCPKCTQWAIGSQLKIKSEDKRLKSLGGKPLDIKLKKVDEENNEEVM